MYRTSISRGCDGKGEKARISVLFNTIRIYGNILLYSATFEPSQKCVFLLEYTDLNTQTAPLPLLAWEAPSLPPHERSARWYVIGGVLVLAVAVYSLLTGNWTFSLALLLIGGMYGWVHRVPPALHQMQLFEDGFLYDQTYTSWQDCKAFWFYRFPGYTELHITLKRGWMRTVTIQTGIVDVERIRETIAPYLTEHEDREERFIHALARKLKL